MDCFFCEIQQDKSKLLGENSDFFYLLDDFPVNPGHILVVPKKHIVSLLEVEWNLWNKLYPSIKEGINIIKNIDLIDLYSKISENHANKNATWFCERALNLLHQWVEFADFNHWINDWKNAGRTVDHLHWHIIPRFTWDMEDPRGWVRYIIPELWNYKIPRDIK